MTREAAAQIFERIALLMELAALTALKRLVAEFVERETE